MNSLANGISTKQVTNAKRRRQPQRICFTPEEDSKLLLLVEKLSFNWKNISKEMGNRSVRQCKERYHHYLSPSINHEEWTNDEDFLLLSAVENIGKRWKLIEKVFKGRTEIDIRNRFYVLTRKIRKEIHQNNSLLGMNHNHKCIRAIQNTFISISPETQIIYEDANANKSDNLNNLPEESSTNNEEQQIINQEDKNISFLDEIDTINDELTLNSFDDIISYLCYSI